MGPWLRTRLNAWRRAVLDTLLFRRLFGERSQGRYLPDTRITPSSCIEHEAGLVLGDHVYIGPFNWIEASGGVTLEEGVQVTSHVSIVTHSSHRSMRAMGRDYVRWGEQGGDEAARPGWIAGPVHIGAWSFIGPHAVIEANTRLGRHTLVRAGSVVRGEFPDHAVLAGNPAVVVGSTATGADPAP